MCQARTSFWWNIPQQRLYKKNNVQKRKLKETARQMKETARQMNEPACPISVSVRAMNETTRQMTPIIPRPIAIIVGVAVLLVATSQQASSSTIELTSANFKDVVTGEKNGMIKFYQSWCGHCTRLKPAWDRLSSVAPYSVFIHDLNCGDEIDLCRANDIRGYPTIKYYIRGVEHTYSGGLSFEVMEKFVNEELAVPCNPNDVTKTCSEKAANYVQKWKEKKMNQDGGSGAGSDLVRNEMERLILMDNKNGSSDVSSELRAWIRERTSILKQLLIGVVEHGGVKSDL